MLQPTQNTTPPTPAPQTPIPRFFDIIVACDCNYGIAKNGKLPWRNTAGGREDMIWFRQHTCLPGTTLIMGRKTFESIGSPLSGRTNIVVTSGPATCPSAQSLDEALQLCGEGPIFCIGGAQLYTAALHHPLIRYAYVTRFHRSYNCDTFICPIVAPTLHFHWSRYATYTIYDMISKPIISI